MIQNRRILITLGGVLVVAVVMGAIYLPGTLFRGALTPTNKITTVSPIETEPNATKQPISSKLNTVTMTDNTTTTKTADVPSNVASDDVSDDEKSSMDADSTTDSTATTETANVPSNVASDDEDDTTTETVTEEELTTPGFTYVETLSVAEDDTNTFSPDQRPASDTTTEYTLNCEPVSLSDLQDFRAGHEMQWKAEITPATNQKLYYTWKGDELPDKSGNPVNALYEEAGNYYVTAVATPTNNTLTTNVTRPIKEPISDSCSVEILPEEEETVSAKEETAQDDKETAQDDEETAQDDEETAQDDEETAQDDEETAQDDEETAQDDEETAQDDEETAQDDEETAQDDEETTVTQVPTTQTTTTAAQNLSACGTPYPDDISGHWAESYIKKGYDLCLFKGIDGKFHPDWEIYRIEAAYMLLYSLGMEPDEGCFNNSCGTPFMDLTSIEEGAVLRPLFLEELIEGYGRTIFKPHGFLTRAEASAMVVKAFFEPFEGCYTPNCGAGHPNNFFNDINDMWQGRYIRVLWDKGIVTGAGPGRVEPNNYITRAEMAKMIVMAHEQTQ